MVIDNTTAGDRKCVDDGVTVKYSQIRFVIVMHRLVMFDDVSDFQIYLEFLVY